MTHAKLSVFCLALWGIVSDNRVNKEGKARTASRNLIPILLSRWRCLPPDLETCGIKTSWLVRQETSQSLGVTGRESFCRNYMSCVCVFVSVFVHVQLQQDSHGSSSPELCVETRGEGPKQSRWSGPCPLSFPAYVLCDDTSALSHAVYRLHNAAKGGETSSMKWCIYWLCFDEKKKRNWRILWMLSPTFL